MNLAERLVGFFQTEIIDPFNVAWVASDLKEEAYQATHGNTINRKETGKVSEKAVEALEHDEAIIAYAHNLFELLKTGNSQTINKKLDALDTWEPVSVAAVKSLVWKEFRASGLSNKLVAKIFSQIVD